MVDKEDFIPIWICIMFRRKSHGYVSCVIIRDRERREERMKEEAEKEAKQETEWPEVTWVEGQLRNWLCRHGLSTAVFLQCVFQCAWLAQKCP